VTLRSKTFRPTKVLALLGAMSFAFVANAQLGRPPTKPKAPSPTSSATNLRAHVGIDQATRLLRSSEQDERIRGIQRAATLGTPEAIALLVELVERGSQSKSDPAFRRGPDTRALLAMARGLARYADQERARAGLLAIVSGKVPFTLTGGANAPFDEGDSAARAELARQVAAIALARTGGDRALEVLYGAARAGGTGQSAAIVALSRHPPRDAGFFGNAGMSLPVPVIRLLGQLGDLRALDVLHVATRSSDVGIRCAALLSLAELGDERAVPLARTAIAESDVRLREASGEVFILLSSPERFKATSAIVADEATTAIGLKMAERVFSPEITKLVAARAWEHPDRELRMAAVRALGRSPDPNAAKALVAPQLLDDRELAYQALHALSRSPAPNAGALIGGLLKSRVGLLAARAYVVRALVRGERAGASDDAVFALASASGKVERSVGVFARIALGDASAESFLGDKEPSVRRAAVLASMARPASSTLEHALLERLAKENDSITRQVLALGLASGDPDGIAKTSTLIDRAESAGGDAPLAAFALARRADETMTRTIGQLMSSRDPVLRAHAARGLAVANLPDATGRLAELYANETDVEVRRAAIAALAARTRDTKAPARRETLELAAELDPDGPVRQAATRALAGAAVPFVDASVHQALWLRLTLDSGLPPGEPYVGSVVRADGLAVPVVFDDEGFALIPGVPPGEARLVLAPLLSTYKETKQP
jgi:HEAT repeat protein